MSLTLRPITEESYAVRLAAQLGTYGANTARARGLTEAEGRRFAEEQIAQLAPDGLRTQGMLMFTAYVDEVEVGWVWLALPQPDGAPRAWIYNIVVDEEFRGEGYGRALLEAAEAELASRGVDQVGLHVFADNPTAIGLYERLGYAYTGHNMAKPLARPAREG